jgi:hypothetical protein
MCAIGWCWEDEPRMTSDFSTLQQTPAPMDADKRVNYSLGLVLGVDEFEQEQFYFLERNRGHNRGLHGYGTICGLQLTTSDTQVLVTPGAAIDSRGRLVQVPRAQCADLSHWLSVSANLKSVETQLGSPVGLARVYVVLCYRECQTDKVPVPGAPCRSEEDTLAPSRITESFELRLTATPPAAEEEAGVRRLGDLLRQIQMTTVAGPGTLLTVNGIEQRVRGLMMSGSPLQSSPLAFDPGEVLLLHPQDAEAVLRSALRVWVTEVRPTLLPSGCDIPADECVLLGALDFGISAAGQVDPTFSPMVSIDENERPYLVTSRVLQESLLGAWGELAQVFGSPLDGGPAIVPPLNGDVTGPIDTTTVQRIRGHPVAPDAPQNAGSVLTWMPDGQGSFRWAPAPLPAPSPLAGDVTGAPGANVLSTINQVPLDLSVAPTASQVLTAVTDTATNALRWRPRNIPELPANLVRFAPPALSFVIVAAGTVNSDGTPPPQLTLGGLTTALLQPRATAARVLLRFDGFEPPSPKIQYIVKALPLLADDKLLAPFIWFEPPAASAPPPAGLVLAISIANATSGLQPYPDDQLRILKLMVEISLYVM